MHVQVGERGGQAILDADVGPVSEGGLILLRGSEEACLCEGGVQEVSQPIVVDVAASAAGTSLFPAIVKALSVARTPIA